MMRLEIFRFNDRDYNAVVNYARESVQYYATFGRSRGDVIKHIVLGKLGELVYYFQFRSYIKGGTADILKINKPEKGRAYGKDRGWDFTLENETTIDVKSIEEGKTKVYFVEPFKADQLAICLVDPLLRKGRYVTTLDRAEMDKHKILYKEQGNRKVYYIDLEKLELNLNLEL